MLHLPESYQHGVLTPLVISYHGAGSSFDEQELVSGMDLLAEEYGFIAVYPQASPDNDNVWQLLTEMAGSEDFVFTRQMVTYLEEKLTIDPQRIYATGFSNGGGMVDLLACSMADKFAAVAPVAGSYIYWATCEPSRPVPVIAFHGTADSAVSYQGSGFSIPSWAAGWAERNGCDPQPTTTIPEEKVSLDTWQRCENDAEVAIYTIEGGEHVWPGSPLWVNVRKLEGYPQAINASQLIWEFFTAHPAPPSIAEAVPPDEISPVETPTQVDSEGTEYNPTGRYQKPGDYIHEMMVDGITRWFAVHIPPGYDPGSLVPLVINFHGRTSNAFEQEEVSQMNVKADAEGFVVVAPQALDNPTTWWGAVPREIGDQDRAFMRQMIAELQREISIDPGRIFATGLSNGGSMSNGMACTLSDLVVAIAPVSGGHVLHEQCSPDHPVAVLAIHGTEDHIIPYEGDLQYGDDRDTIPIHTWMEAWAERNNCDPTPDVSEPFPSITLETWGNCDQGADVVLLTIEGGEHTWPTTRYGTDWGDIQLYIDATDQVWEFFAAHPRPASP
jgi:polyhydroxybutyrate depolymerase